MAASTSQALVVPEHEWGQRAATGQRHRGDKCNHLGLFKRALGVRHVPRDPRLAEALNAPLNTGNPRSQGRDTDPSVSEGTAGRRPSAHREGSPLQEAHQPAP